MLFRSIDSGSVIAPAVVCGGASGCGTLTGSRGDWDVLSDGVSCGACSGMLDVCASDAPSTEDKAPGATGALTGAAGWQPASSRAAAIKAAACFFMVKLPFRGQTAPLYIQCPFSSNFFPAFLRKARQKTFRLF